jgi:hypothetical protein
MLLDNGWVMALGAAILGVGILLRFLPRPGADSQGDEGDREDRGNEGR